MTHPAREIGVWLHSSLAIVLLATVAGCGANGPGRHQVTGTVRFAGQPVPKGEVIFEPDPAKNNKGPQARAFIEQGKFQTQPGQGAVAGPAVVRVLAYDGKAHPESPSGSALCLPYELHVDLPAADSTHDFVIPTP